MPGFVKPFNGILSILLLLWVMPGLAGLYATQIRQASLIKNDAEFNIQTKIDYLLSPTAKEALHKGVPLFWTVWLEIREVRLLWDQCIHRQKLPYRLKFHALLNQYEVLSGSTHAEMFLSLNAALNYMSALTAAAPVSQALLQSGRRYKLAVKSRFERELLPVPLRPFAYLDSQWFLSSDWYIWPLQE